MQNEQVRRTYGCPTDQVKYASEIILGVLKSDRYGALVSERMVPTFQTDYEAAVTALVNAINEQARAKGDVHLGTAGKDDARADCHQYLGTVRDVAKVTFRGQGALLHDEFCVGHRTPLGLANIIGRAEKVHGACVKYAEQLAADGWPATDTANFATVLSQLKAAAATRVAAGAVKFGATGAQINLANSVYRMTRLVQIAADFVYPEAKAESDPASVGARAQFLIVVFPPRESATEDAPTETPAVPAATATSTPTVAA